MVGYRPQPEYPMEKVIALILLLCAQTAFSATLRVTLNLEGIDARRIERPIISFESTNPLCNQVVTDVVPAVVPRTQNATGTVAAAGDQAVLEVETRYGGNNFCAYRVRSVAIGLRGYSTWISLGATDHEDGYLLNPTRNAPLEILRQDSEFAAVCDRQRCETFVNGRPTGNDGSRNVADFFLDAASLRGRSILETTIYLVMRD